MAHNVQTWAVSSAPTDASSHLAHQITLTRKPAASRDLAPGIRQPHTERYQATQFNDEEHLAEGIETLASKYGHYGYRPVTMMLNQAD